MEYADALENARTDALENPAWSGLSPEAKQELIQVIARRYMSEPEYPEEDAVTAWLNKHDPSRRERVNKINNFMRGLVPSAIGAGKAGVTAIGEFLKEKPPVPTPPPAPKPKYQIGGPVSLMDIFK